ncbi:alpha-amylase, partial [Salmonella enterica subsp. enterica]
MKLAAFALTLIPGIAIASSWTSPGFPTFSTQETGRFTSHAALTKGTRALTLHIDQQCWQPSGAIKLNQMLSLKPCEGAPPQWRLFKDGDYTITVDTRSGTPTLLLSIKTEPERTAQLAYQCPVWDGSPLTLDVRQTFPEGTVVRDYYSGQTDTVQNGQITLQPADS